MLIIGHRLTTSLSTWFVAGWVTVLAVKVVSKEEEETEEGKL